MLKLLYEFQVASVFQDLQRYSYKCLKCDTIIPRRRTLGNHIRVDTQLKQITCETAHPDGPGLNDYQKDLFLTSGRRQLLCHTCGASFTEKSTFLNHIEESHGEVVGKKFFCEFCPYAANVHRFLREHYERMHPPTPRTRSHICEQCGKAFFEKTVLDEHVNYVHLRKKQFQCDMCPKVFYRPQSYRKHKACHSGKRPYVCTQCGQGFKVAYNLKVHKRLHTGEKPYKCKQCEAAFAQKNSLDVHMKKHMKREGISLKPGDGSRLNVHDEESSERHPPCIFTAASAAAVPALAVPGYQFCPNL